MEQWIEEFIGEYGRPPFPDEIDAYRSKAEYLVEWAQEPTR